MVFFFKFKVLFARKVVVIATNSVGTKQKTKQVNKSEKHKTEIQRIPFSKVYLNALYVIHIHKTTVYRV